MPGSARPLLSSLRDEPYITLATLLVGLGLLDGLLERNEALTVALLLLGCLCAFAALQENGQA